MSTAPQWCWGSRTAWTPGRARPGRGLSPGRWWLRRESRRAWTRGRVGKVLSSAARSSGARCSQGPWTVGRWVRESTRESRSAVASTDGSARALESVRRLWIGNSATCLPGTDSPRPTRRSSGWTRRCWRRSSRRWLCVSHTSVRCAFSPTRHAGQELAAAYRVETPTGTSDPARRSWRPAAENWDPRPRRCQ